MTDEVSTTRKVGGVGNVYNVFDTTPTSTLNIKYSSIKRLTKRIMGNSVNLLQILSMVLAVRILGLEDQNKYADAFNYSVPF